MKKIVIIGGTSGMGRNIALRFVEAGNIVGVTGRREELLTEIKCINPDNIFTRMFDVTNSDSDKQLLSLINEMGGMDVCIYCAGYGERNIDLDTAIELKGVDVNVVAFTKMVVTAYHFFKEKGSGHIVTISSIAATRGLGVAPSYSATKSCQAVYLEALQQKVNGERLKIDFTTIQPGFVKTDFINYKYPMTMDVDYASKRIYRAIVKRKRKAVIDWRWQIVVWIWKLIPRGLWVRIRLK